jgi:hypothetical protein
MQNYCKSAYLCVSAFPGISGDSLGLLHGCCTKLLVRETSPIELRRES